MPILSNTPTIRYITIQNLVVQDSNVYYPIVTTETSKKYIYWDKDSPYELICEDEILEDRANLYLLVINKKGNFTIVNQNSISVNFDGDIKINGINNKLNATVEKVDEHTKKFMSVTEDINGINKTVGTITEDLNETNEKLTNYKQTADQIAIDLQNTNKKYNDDKEFNRLRENIVSLLINENTLLMGLNSSIKDITRDNNFTEEEKTKIKDIQSEITNKNALLIIEVEKLVSMLEKEGLTDKKNQLTSIKEEYDNSLNLLTSTLTSLISGNLITPTQITILINCISNVSTKLTKLKNICDDIIFLGTGGTLYEEITKINITASDITARVDSVETIQNSANGKVAELEKWKKSAELKITDDAITNTVKKSFYTKSETDDQITSKGYQTASQVQQTANSIKTEVNDTKKGLESKITQTAESLRSDYTSKVNGVSSSLTQTKDNLEAKITDAKNNLQSQITLNKNAIAQKVTNKDFESYKTQTANAISSKVASSDLSTLVKQGANSWGISINGKLKGTNYTFDGENFTIGTTAGENTAYHSNNRSLWKHKDGDYTLVSANGLERYSAGEYRKYHYLMHNGSVQVEDIVWVNLPPHIANKKGINYTVSISVRGYAFRDKRTKALMQIYCTVLERRSDKFQIRVDLFGWRPEDDNFLGQQTYGGYVNIDYVIIA